jgi:glycosyltransferase involved in cell wall biosynthesis
MVRPSTPRRQPGFTLQVLSRLIRRHDGNIEVILFGCQPDDPDFHQLIGEQRGISTLPWRHAGVLTRAQLASLLNEIDIFADFSSFQAMGLTAMEAMACGAAVLLPKEGGASAFARHKENAFITDTSSLDASVDAMEQLLRDEALRSKLQQQAIFDICQFYPEKVAFKTLEALFP